MKKVKINLVNCYGISKMNTTMEFSKDNNGNSINAHLIYAPNGTMKTSFADTIRDIQNGETTVDYYFPERKVTRDVNAELEDGTERELRKDDVLVVSSYDEQYKSDKVSTLLVNKKLKKEYDEIYDEITRKLEILSSKLKGEVGTRNNVFENLTADFGFTEDNILECLEKIQSEYQTFDEESLRGIKYVQVFNKDTSKVFESDQFKQAIKDYIESYEKLLMGNPVFKKGFDHTAAETVFANLKKNGFFKAKHKVVLDGTTSQLSEEEFKQKIEEAKRLILSRPEMQVKFNNSTFPPVYLA